MTPKKPVNHGGRRGHGVSRQAVQIFSAISLDIVVTEAKQDSRAVFAVAAVV
jgi:hypothetical protein